MPSRRSLGARAEQRAASAASAVNSLTEGTARGVVGKWMDDNRAAIPNLALWLMSGGMGNVTLKDEKCPGHMSRGTSSNHVLGKTYVCELLCGVGQISHGKSVKPFVPGLTI